MGYELAMQKAGATVLAFQAFGSYQGDWLALVLWNEEFLWIEGSYGSCTHCDAFEGEFGWSELNDDDKEGKLADFGKTYLNLGYTQEEMEKRCVDRADRGIEEEQMLRFVREYSTSRRNMPKLVAAVLQTGKVQEEN